MKLSLLRLEVDSIICLEKLDNAITLPSKLKRHQTSFVKETWPASKECWTWTRGSTTISWTESGKVREETKYMTKDLYCRYVITSGSWLKVWKPLVWFITQNKRLHVHVHACYCVGLFISMIKHWYTFIQNIQTNNLCYNTGMCVVKTQIHYDLILPSI